MRNHDPFRRGKSRDSAVFFQLVVASCGSARAVWRRTNRCSSSCFWLVAPRIVRNTALEAGWSKTPQVSFVDGTTKGLRYSRVSIGAAAELSGKVSARKSIAGHGPSVSGPCPLDPTHKLAEPIHAYAV